MQRRVSKFPVLYRKFGKNGIHLLGGLQDNRSAIYSVDNQWRVTNLGDGTYNAFDPVQDSLLYCSSQYQNLYRSTNFGNQWEELIPPNQEAGFVSPLFFANPIRIEFIQAAICCLGLIIEGRHGILLFFQIKMKNHSYCRQSKSLQ